MLNFTLAGNLGRDCEVKTTQTGKKMIVFSVATSKREKNPQTGAYEDKTTWVECVYFASENNTIATYLKKGQAVVVIGEGALTTYKDNYGMTKAKLVCTAQTVKLQGYGAAMPDDDVNAGFPKKTESKAPYNTTGEVRAAAVNNVPADIGDMPF